MNTNVLHPMIVHFPIALLLTGLALATVALFCGKCCRKHDKASACESAAKSPSCLQLFSFWLLALGALGAVCAVCSGSLFATMVSPFRDTHAMLAFSTMIVAVIEVAIYAFYLFKARQNRAVGIIAYAMYVMVGVLVAITGHYGGLMVY